MLSTLALLRQTYFKVATGSALTPSAWPLLSLNLRWNPMQFLENEKPHHEAYQLVGVPLRADVSRTQDIASIWDGILLMAVPKTRVSRSRKRMKHKQHIPEKIGWYTCEKCGEPKRQHRICTKNMNICAMRPWEYKEYVAKNSNSNEKVTEKKFIS